MGQGESNSILVIGSGCSKASTLPGSGRYRDQMQYIVRIARCHHPADQGAAQHPHCPIPSSSGSGCSTASKLTHYSMAVRYGAGGESNSILVIGSGCSKASVLPGSGRHRQQVKHSIRIADTIIQWIRMQYSIQINTLLYGGKVWGRGESNSILVIGSGCSKASVLPGNDRYRPKPVYSSCFSNVSSCQIAVIPGISLICLSRRK